MVCSAVYCNFNSIDYTNNTLRRHILTILKP